MMFMLYTLERMVHALYLCEICIIIHRLQAKLFGGFTKKLWQWELKRTGTFYACPSSLSRVKHLALWHMLTLKIPWEASPGGWWWMMDSQRKANFRETYLILILESSWVIYLWKCCIQRCWTWLACAVVVGDIDCALLTCTNSWKKLPDSVLLAQIVWPTLKFILCLDDIFPFFKWCQLFLILVTADCLIASH